jgi:aminopeptidase N
MMKRASRLVIALLLISISPALSRDSYPRPTALDVQHYRIRLEIKEAGEQITAASEVLVAFNGDGVKQVALDFAGMTVDEVRENDAVAKFSHDGARLVIALQGAYGRGDRCRLSVKYHGSPADGLLIKKNKFGDRTVFADNWPDRARHWFPAIDHPSDKATVEFFVTAPDRYDVVANGALVETTSNQDGTRLTHWSETVPIPTYCMVVGATEFTIINAGSSRGVPVLYYLYPKDRDNGVKDYGRAVRMLEFYTEMFGPYPYEKLALVQSSTRFGGMENASAIFFDEKAFNGSGRLEGVVAHEIAHQWFGDSVTEADWHHLWLSEGFATYFENVFFEYADGRDKLVARMLADKERYLKAYGATAPPIHDPTITDLLKLLNRNNYEKGGWVLHMLRRVVGDERFFAAVRDYYRTHRDRNALTEDLQRVMEFHSGRRLDWFFRQWIYEPGYPVYDARWRWDEAAKELRVRVTQKQEKTIFQMPIDLEFDVNGKARRETVQVSEREQAFTFKLDARPRLVRLDPDEWVLKVATVAEEK